MIIYMASVAAEENRRFFEVLCPYIAKNYHLTASCLHEQMHDYLYGERSDRGKPQVFRGTLPVLSPRTIIYHLTAPY